VALACPEPTFRPENHAKKFHNKPKILMQDRRSVLMDFHRNEFPPF